VAIAISVAGVDAPSAEDEGELRRPSSSGPLFRFTPFCEVAITAAEQTMAANHHELHCMDNSGD